MAKKNTKNTKNETINTSAANGNNTLHFATYTGSKEGAKTIAVVYGFTGKDDERLPYIANMEPTPKAKKGKKSPKKEAGYAHCTYSCLPINGTDRIPCVIWGADPRWVDVAKYTAATINDLDALTQEQYDRLGEMAAAVYEAIKADNQAKRASDEGASVKPAKATKTTKGTEATTGGTLTQKASKTKKGAKDTKKTTDINANMTYTQEEVENIVRQVCAAMATTLKWDTNAFEPLVTATMTAVANAKRKAA